MRDGFAQVCKGSHKIFADSRQIRGFTGFADLRWGSRIRADSRQIRGKSSTRFAPIRDGFATDALIRTHVSHKFARIRDGYYTIIRVACASPLGHVTRADAPVRPARAPGRAGGRPMKAAPKRCSKWLKMHQVGLIESFVGPGVVGELLDVLVLVRIIL
eukprot:5973916-Prymnesium_polylepis.1